MSQQGDSSSNGADEIMLFGVRVRVDSPASDSNLVVTVPVSPADGSSRSQPIRKRRNRWTQDEHKLFLEGLLKVGNRDWKGISKYYVKTRTRRQVASHTQKYFLRQSNRNQGRRRSSVLDITTDSVSHLLKEEQVNGKPAANPPSTFGSNNEDDVITVD